MPASKEPLFIDLDETLIYAREILPGDVLPPEARRVFGHEVVRRPETLELLGLCREGGRPVFLFTTASFSFALACSLAFGLGFDENSIFSLEMILNCRPGLSPRSALIDNLPPTAEPTRLKMAALGLGPTQVWVIPPFAPPQFSSARLFLLGLPLRLARFDRVHHSVEPKRALG